MSKIIKHNKNIHFDLTTDNAYAGGQEGIINSWNQLKNMLKLGNINIDCLENIPDIPFLGVLDKVLSYELIRKKVSNDIYFYSKGKKFYRAAIIQLDEIADTARFIPRAEFMRSENRFSPKGIEWLYLGFNRNEIDAKRCCFAEVRASEDSNVWYCEFTSAFGINDLVIDLTIVDNKSLEDICIVPYRKSYEECVYIFISELYMKLLSEEIFKPIDTVDKEIEYLPFQFMANYFKGLGYKGIIYKSTVSKYGKNIVVFDKNLFVPKQTER